jgi:FAD-linked sulfhydryl oxidase
MQMTKAQNPAKHSAPITRAIMPTLDEDCPADVERLGRSTWTLLHTMAAQYPSRPSPEIQQQTKSFVSLFANLYPCSHCAEDFRDWMKRPGNQPRMSSKDEFGLWMCEAHNAVNEKLGKSQFDCSQWKVRWIDGPADGRCG